MPGFSAENLTPAPDLAVIGNVCRSDNVEAVAARASGIPVAHIASALQQFALYGREVTVCAGTHGKTTTSSLVAWLLDAAGERPGFFIGGVPNNFAQGFRHAELGDPFVIEGDEYDTAFFEKTAKFLHYLPSHAIITSIEHDHIDIYPTEATYLEAFRRFIALVPASGVLVVHGGDVALTHLVPDAKAKVLGYGVDGFTHYPALPAWWATDVRTTPDGGQDFEVQRRGETMGRGHILASGLHNVANALAAVVLCHEAYGVELAALMAALPGFTGTRRRQELLGEPRGIRLYDDFAHHPTAVSTTLWGLRRRHPDGKLIAVFEPRSATACRNRHQADYVESFDAADVVLLAPLGRTGLASNEQLDTEAIARGLRVKGKDAVACTSLDVLEREVLSRVSPADTVALLSNGAFGDVPKHLLAHLNAE
jgi:UDP-N-acetylmuramate: L-alanyl-gamma-D-glutamyl-meso-diaminopimelate ligase